MEGKTVSVLGKSVYYVENGTGAPVVYVHGNWGSSAWWTKVMDLRGRRTIALDLPNFGRSEDIGRADLALYAEYLAAFIEALGLGQVDLVAHSLGGAVAQALVEARPELLSSLALVDSSAPSGLVTPEANYAAFDMFARNRDMLRMALAGVAPTMDDPALLDRLADDAFMMARHAFAGNARALERKMDLGKLMAFGGKVLVLWGRKDAIVSEAMARETAAAFADARLELLEGVGHSLEVEDPARFVALLEGFLSL